jgi:dTDP-4-dehydrorhamnose 3,5-epimerase
MPVKEIEDLYPNSDLKIISFEKFNDNRGFFEEVYKFSQLSMLPNMVQWNVSHSFKNVFRGMHIQCNPGMGKLVRCIKGKIVDFALDLRKGSPNYLRTYSIPINGYDDFSIWIPEGFAHGFFAVEESYVLYGCSGEHNGINEYSIKNGLFKAMINFEEKDLIISEKDKNAILIDEWCKSEDSNNFIYKEQ